ncbi:MAG: clostripain-related cysteine peptidase [Parabacteroides gordonii]|uniref:clostripain-related cysteine peptidase n=1 Tax=Parabacteroides gordonii TaxID=574930 RepID=UPI003A86A3ED
MAADNSLSGFDKQNINSMLEGGTKGALNGGNLIVYIDAKDTIPLLIQITPAGKKVLKSYPEHENSVSVETMKEVIEEVKTNFPAKSYGLMLWSHGSNWFPSDMTSLKAFGQDKSNWMELAQIKEVLADNSFDFIIFDACYMAGIEVLYELKDKANYIMAAPSEILGNGFPYSKIISRLFKMSPDLTGICDEFYDYYANSSTPFATIALVSTPQLEPLAIATRNIMQDNFDKTEDIELNSLQRYFRSPYYGMYDFDDYISRIAPEEQYAQFQAALEKAVIYKKNTPSFMIGYSGGYYINHFCGLSSFTIRDSYSSSIKNKYTELDWYKAVYQ